MTADSWNAQRSRRKPRQQLQPCMQQWRRVIRHRGAAHVPDSPAGHFDSILTLPPPLSQVQATLQPRSCPPCSQSSTEGPAELQHHSKQHRAETSTGSGAGWAGVGCCDPLCGWVRREIGSDWPWIWCYLKELGVLSTALFFRCSFWAIFCFLPKAHSWQLQNCPGWVAVGTWSYLHSEVPGNVELSPKQSWFTDFLPSWFIGLILSHVLRWQVSWTKCGVNHIDWRKCMHDQSKTPNRAVTS